MNNMWWNLQWRLCLCYIYDIIIFGNDIETALENLIAVFQSFRWTNLKLKLGTCSFFQTEVKFLGHVVSEVRIKCDPEKAQSVQNWHIPSNIKEIQCFLEFVPYYRRFVSDFSTIAHLLIRLIEKNIDHLYGISRVTRHFSV